MGVLLSENSFWLVARARTLRLHLDRESFSYSIVDLIPLTCYKNWSCAVGFGDVVVPCPGHYEYPTRPSSASLFKSCSGSVFGTPAMRSALCCMSGEGVPGRGYLNPESSLYSSQ
jgi:hypothetical protein